MYERLKPAMSVVDSISEWSGKITGFFVVLAGFLVTLEVVLRYGFNRPTQWNMELVIYLSGALYLMGGAWVHSLRSHIILDVIYGRFTTRQKAILDLVTVPLLLVFSGALVWAGTDWAWSAFIKGTTSGSQWDPLIFPMRLIIPVAAFLLLIQGLVKFIRDLDIAIKGTE